MRNRIDIVILMSMMFMMLKAQIVPGYQGKKNVISYQLSSSPAVLRPNYFNRALFAYNYFGSEQSSLIPFNFTHALSYERVTGRKFALGVDHGLVVTKHYIKFTQTVRDNATNTDITFQFNNTLMKMYGHYFTGSLIFYGQNSLAPYGKYFKLNFGYCLTYAQFTQDHYSTEPSAAQGTIYTFETKGMKFRQSSTHAGFTIGSNRIYKNKWIVSKGFNFSYLFKPDYNFTEYDNGNDELYKRLRGHDLATIYLKIGYLF